MAETTLTDGDLALIRALVREMFDSLLRQSNVGRYVSGVISSVSGPDAQFEPDDAPGTLASATITNAADQVEGTRVVVWCGRSGTSYVIGVVPT